MYKRQAREKKNGGQALVLNKKSRGRLLPQVPWPVSDILPVWRVRRKNRPASCGTEPIDTERVESYKKDLWKEVGIDSLHLHPFGRSNGYIFQYGIVQVCFFRDTGPFTSGIDDAFVRADNHKIKVT